MRISTRIVSASTLLLLGCATWSAGTPEASPKFESADVHPSPKPATLTAQFMRNRPVWNGRYQIHTASLLDLIRFAWGCVATTFWGDRLRLTSGVLKLARKLRSGRERHAARNSETHVADPARRSFRSENPSGYPAVAGIRADGGEGAKFEKKRMARAMPDSRVGCQLCREEESGSKAAGIFP